MDLLCTLPIGILFLVLGILVQRNSKPSPQYYDSEWDEEDEEQEMMDQVMMMEMMDDENWD